MTPVLSGAHGLSLLVTTEIGEEKHTLIFDCGPESKSIDRNIKALGVDLTRVEAIALSVREFIFLQLDLRPFQLSNADLPSFLHQHWHSDHSGGILQAVKLISEAKAAEGSETSSTIVDLHPSRPEARSIWPPHLPAPLIRLPDDPTFDEITAAGGKVSKHDEAHTIVGNTAFISGQIKRQTDFETGLLGGSQWVDGAWRSGPGNPGWLIMDERYCMIDVKDKGLVVLSSCSRKLVFSCHGESANENGRNRRWNSQRMQISY